MNEQSETRIRIELIKTRKFKVISILFILFLLTLILIPYGISYGIKQALLHNGAEKVEIEDVDFNPFTGKLVVDNLFVEKSNSKALELVRLSAYMDWLPLFKKRIHLQKVGLHDLKLQGRQLGTGDLVIAGLSLPAKQKKPKKPVAQSEPWGIAADDVSLDNIRISFKFPQQDYQLNFRDIRMKGLKSWEPDKPSKLQVTATLNNAPFELNVDAQPFSETLSFKGNVKISQLALDHFAHFASKHLPTLSGILSLNQDFDIRIKNKEFLEIKNSGSIKLDKLNLILANIAVRHDALDWNGKLELKQNQLNKTAAYSAEGSLEQKNLALNLPSQKILVHQKQLGWKGNFSANQDIPATIKTSGSINLSGLLIKQDQLSLANIQNLIINKVTINSLNQIETGSIQVANIAAIEPGKNTKKTASPGMFKAASVNVAHFKLTNQNHADIGIVDIKNSTTSVTRDSKGKIAQLAGLSQPETKKAPATKSAKKTETAKKPEKAFTFILKKILLSGKNSAQFKDYSVKPVFSRTLNIQRFSMENINSQKTEVKSPFELKGKFGKYSSLNLKGHAQLFTKKPSFKVTGNIEQVDLHQLSSYTSRTLGYDMSSGTMNAEVNIEVINGKIDGKNELKINNLEVKPTDPDKIKALTTQLSMPLDAALSMLRDKNNDIKLSLPISGSLDDPKFNLSDVINTALGTVMKKAAMSYLSKALQPYGAIITVVQLANKASKMVSLDPVVFSPASTTPSSKAADYLSKLVKILDERPQLRIRLCGIATPADRDALIQQEMKKRKTSGKTSDTQQGSKPGAITIPEDTLLQLARKRSEIIKDTLVTQHKIAPDRLFICSPEFSKDQKKPPRVEISI